MTPAAALPSSTARFPLTVTLLEVTPSSFLATDPARSLVTVRARVRNASASAVAGLRVRLVVQRPSMSTRQALAAFAQAAPTRTLGSSILTSDRVEVGTPTMTGGELAPGGRADVVLTLQTAGLNLAAGAHGAAVEVLAGSTRVGLQRTFLTAAGTGLAPTRLTVLVPLVAGRGDEDAQLGGQLSQAEVTAGVTGGRLAHLLTATDDPRISWALDPALLASVESAATPAAATREAPSGSGPSSAATASGPDTSTVTESAAARSWLAGLRAEASGRDIVALPYGDPDLASLARSPNGPDLLTAAGTAGGDLPAGLEVGTSGAHLLNGIAWPADEAANAATTTLAAGAGDSAMVLDDASQPTTDPELTYTPTGRSTIAAGAATLAGLVADSTMSRILAGATDPGEEAAVVQRLLAEVATTALERPNDGRSLLIVAPRSFDPDPATIQALIAALDSSGWTQLQGLGNLLATPAPRVDRSAPTLPPGAVRGELPTAQITAVASALHEVDGFATALQGPDQALADRRRAALLLLATAWRGHNDELPAARQRLQVAIEGLAAGVRIVAGSVRNLAATRSELPVTVVNELDVGVSVDLVLQPRAPRVQLSTVPRQALAAHSQQRIAVPVRALANGTVVLDAQLRSPAGSAIGASVPVTLNVRMGVEGWITGAVGAVAALLLIVGVVRAVRRPRRRLAEPGQPLAGAVEPGGSAPVTER